MQSKQFYKNHTLAGQVAVVHRIEALKNHGVEEQPKGALASGRREGFIAVHT